jgi:1-deoxy-D-xylulose-5-phosphate synthase
MIVVLNDNEMSIAKNVGGLSRYLNHLRTAPTYIRTKRTVEAALDRLPGIGTSLARRVERFKNSVKYFLVPGMMFEELGWTYLGPVNGHDVKAMCEAFDEAKHMEGPVIVHCLTRKGKGYKPAEMNPEVFHSVGRFEVSTGQRLGEAKYSFTDAFSAAVLDAARRRDDVMAVTAAMPGGTGLSAMAKEFPARCFDVGIAEQHAVTFASGLALAGKRPVVALYTTFLQRAYDQLVHDVCLPDLPVVFALDRAGIVGEDGETHQGVFDISFCLPIPNLIVTAPRDGAILQSLLDEMLNAEHPAVIRYPKDAAGEPVRPDAAVARGRAQVLREGSDMAIIAVGDRVRTALAAADKLHEVGIEAAVIDPVYLKPVDLETIASVTGRVRGLVVVEDGAVSGGFGQALANRLLAEGKLPGRVRLLGVPDRFIAQGSRREVLEDLGLDANGVAAAIRDLMEADSIVRS